MKYKSEIYEVVHQDAVEMFKIGAISEDRMREFDRMCLVQEPKPIYASEESPKTEYAAVRPAG